MVNPVAVCKNCGQAIYMGAIGWLAIDHPVFPQYCPDAFQNEAKDRKHEPVAENS